MHDTPPGDAAPATTPAHSDGEAERLEKMLEAQRQMLRDIFGSLHWLGACLIKGPRDALRQS